MTAYQLNPRLARNVTKNSDRRLYWNQRRRGFCVSLMAVV
jgi:hypothetical protein